MASAIAGRLFRNNVEISSEEESFEKRESGHSASSTQLPELCIFIGRARRRRRRGRRRSGRILVGWRTYPGRSGHIAVDGRLVAGRRAEDIVVRTSPLCWSRSAIGCDGRLFGVDVLLFDALQQSQEMDKLFDRQPTDARFFRRRRIHSRVPDFPLHLRQDRMDAFNRIVRLCCCRRLDAVVNLAQQMM